MKKKGIAIMAGIAFAAGLTSCSPVVFNMSLEMRHPSLSGFEVAGKSMAVVYLDDLSGKDSVFNNAVATGFAQALEKDYFNGAQAVSLYRMEKDMAGNYSEKDTLVNLALDSGADVIFMFESPVFGEGSFSDAGKATSSASASSSADSSVSSAVLSSADSSVVVANLPYTLNLYVYDTMDKADKVRVYKGHSFVKFPFTVASGASENEKIAAMWRAMEQPGLETGEKSSRKFLSQWQLEEYGLYYYDMSDVWDRASQAAYEYRWKDAADIWMSLLSTQNPVKLSCASYNLAVAFYMLGDFDLALQWLDFSDKHEKVELSKTLREKILKRKN